MEAPLFVCACMDGLMGGWVDGQVGARMHACLEERMHVQTRDFFWAGKKKRFFNLFRGEKRQSQKGARKLDCISGSRY